MSSNSIFSYSSVFDSLKGQDLAKENPMQQLVDAIGPGRCFYAAAALPLLDFSVELTKQSVKAFFEALGDDFKAIGHLLRCDPTRFCREGEWRKTIQSLAGVVAGSLVATAVAGSIYHEGNNLLADFAGSGAISLGIALGAVALRLGLKISMPYDGVAKSIAGINEQPQLSPTAQLRRVDRRRRAHSD